jgi:uncharacterized protein (DUF58 family)
VASRLRLSGSPLGGSALSRALERYLGITLSGVGLALAVVGGLVIARNQESPPLYLLAYGLAFVFVSAFVLGRRRLAVVADRSALPRRVREGQKVEVDVTLTARRRTTAVVFEEELDQHLGRSTRFPVTVLHAGEAVTHTYGFTPRQRGVYPIGPLVATWADPFGLTKKRVVLSEPAELIVHPTTEAVDDRVLSRAWEDPPIRPPVSKPWPTGFEFYGMRDYALGDDPRRIVWRATARTMDLDGRIERYLVRESEQGITDRVSMVLDTNRASHSYGDPSETFEVAVKVAASVAAKHLKDGFAVTVEVNGGRLVDGLRGGQKQVLLLDELARLERESIALSATLERYLSNPRRDTHLVLITPYLDPEASTRVRILLDRGVSVLLVLVLDDTSEPDSLHRAGALGCNVVEVRAGQPLSVVFNRVLARGRR